MAVSHCGAEHTYLAVARHLMVASAQGPAVCSLAVLVENLSRCSTVQGCAFYWVAIVLFFGARSGMMKVEEVFETLGMNFTHQIRRARGSELVNITRRKLHLVGHRRGPDRSAVDEESMMILTAFDALYPKEPHVEPFVRHLQCYTARRGMRFHLDTQGHRVSHRPLAVLNVSIVGEFFLSLRGAGENSADEAKLLVEDLIWGRAERAVELVRLENSLAINYASSLNFIRIWSILEQLPTMRPGALVIYYDVDVTIRPDSWGDSLAEMLLSHPWWEGSVPHVFLADTWLGTECVNSGFLALRNTPVAKLFLELWREKMWWASSWDQAALAETVLELVGMEMSRRSNGMYAYDLRCLALLFPLPNGVYAFQRYCDCWHTELDRLAGPYRHRTSAIVGFVDPERVEVNFVPNSLFWDHNWELKRMHLAPHLGRPAMRPLVVHWAGMHLQRLELMRQLLALDSSMRNRSVDWVGCPTGSRPDPARVGAAAVAAPATPRAEAATPWGFGSRARQVRCCKKLVAHKDYGAWPWTEPPERGGWQRWVGTWGCLQLPIVRLAECVELLGIT